MAFITRYLWREALRRPPSFESRLLLAPFLPCSVQLAPGLQACYNIGMGFVME